MLLFTFFMEKTIIIIFFQNVLQVYKKGVYTCGKMQDYPRLSQLSYLGHYYPIFFYHFDNPG